MVLVLSQPSLSEINAVPSGLSSSAGCWDCIANGFFLTGLVLLLLVVACAGVLVTIVVSVASDLRRLTKANLLSLLEAVLKSFLLGGHEMDNDDDDSGGDDGNDDDGDERGASALRDFCEVSAFAGVSITRSGDDATRAGEEEEMAGPLVGVSCCPLSTELHAVTAFCSEAKYLKKVIVVKI